MSIQASSTEPKKIVLFPLHDFPLMSFSCVVEVMRIANRYSNEQAYHWQIVTEHGEAAESSSGIRIDAHNKLEEVRSCDRILIFSANSGQKYKQAAVLKKLQNLAANGVQMCAVSSGSFVLANAGLLDGYRATIHWENLPAFRELYPQVYATSQIFEMDRDRFTCSGGIAAMDMMLKLAELDYGSELAGQIQQMYQHDRQRSSRDQQKMAERFDLIGLSPKLGEVIELMQRNIEDPLSPKELAQHVGVSLRQLERLFKKYRTTTPQRYYIKLRLEHARQLLLHTPQSGLEVAIASGFSSHSHFIKSYRDYFGITPHEERRTA